MLDQLLNFVLTTNSRGKTVTEALARFISLEEKDYCDIGCAYGGFIVSFHECGCRTVCGFDISQDLLNLAEYNFMDHPMDPPPRTFIKDVTIFDDIKEFKNSFDIITTMM